MHSDEDADVSIVEVSPHSLIQLAIDMVVGDIKDWTQHVLMLYPDLHPMPPRVNELWILSTVCLIK